MEHTNGIVVRRSRAEWQQLVRQWKRSGSGAGEFAARHGIDPRKLSWWKWHLGRDHEHSAPRTQARHVDVRLVPVDVVSERVAPPDADAAGWELVTAGGDRLAVRGALTASDLAAVLAALTRARRRR